MTKEEILKGIDAIMAEGFEVEPEALKPEFRLIEDMGLDSLDGVDLVVMIEKKFACRLEEVEVRKMRTLGDVYDYCVRVVEK